MEQECTESEKEKSGERVEKIDREWIDRDGRGEGLERREKVRLDRDGEWQNIRQKQNGRKREEQRDKESGKGVRQRAKDRSNLRTIESREVEN